MPQPSFATPPLPEMRLRSAAVFPPMVTLLDLTPIPPHTFASAWVPETSVPIKLPTMVEPVAPASTSMP